MTETPDQVADRLYTLVPERFVAARDEAVAALRAAGDRDGATRLAALRRPSVAAWLVNLLALRRPTELAELLSLGAELREAQHELHGPALRELSVRRRGAVGALAAQARQLAVAEGKRATGLPLSEVEATLQAALTEVDVADQVRTGRLVRAVSYSGFGEPPRPRFQLITGGGNTEPEVPDEQRGPTPAPPALVGRSTARRQAARVQQQTADQASRLVAERQEEVRRADEELGAAAEQERQAAAELDEAARRHARAQADMSAALMRRKGAERGVQAAARALRAAQRRAGDEQT